MITLSSLTTASAAAGSRDSHGAASWFFTLTPRPSLSCAELRRTGAAGEVELGLGKYEASAGRGDGVSFVCCFLSMEGNSISEADVFGLISLEG